MAIINKIDNIASITYDGVDYESSPATTFISTSPTICKTVDKGVANIGDELTYTIVIKNGGLTAMDNVVFTDVIPTGSDYITNSFTLNGTQVNPSISGTTLLYTIPSISPLGSATIQFKVLVVGGTV